jgi:hypothetical protein
MASQCSDWNATQGYIRQRGDAWELRVYLGTDPVTGTAALHRSLRARGKRAAQRVLAEMVTVVGCYGGAMWSGGISRYHR